MVGSLIVVVADDMGGGLWFPCTRTRLALLLFFCFSDLVSLFSYVHSVAGFFFFLSFFLFCLFILFRGQFGFRVLVSYIGVS